MPNNHSDMIKRSVDSLQRLYAVVVGLAVTICIQQVLFDGGKLHPWLNEATKQYFLTDILLARLPVVLAFVASIVPFFHGMNRHLDVVYIEDGMDPHKEGFIVIDFFIFFFESCMLVALASMVASGDDFFLVLAVLLVVDACWAFMTHYIHYCGVQPSTFRWFAINAVTVFLLLAIYYSNTFTIGPRKTWALASIAILRTVCDYVACWRFYIPAPKAKK